MSCMFPGDIAQANTTLSTQTTTAQGLFIEMFLTAELVFVVLMLAIEKSRDTFLPGRHWPCSWRCSQVGRSSAAVRTRTDISAHSGTFFTGASLNPARSFGCAVAGRTFPGYHWIYWLGPVLGACLAAGYYRFVRYSHYEEANPGQDAPREADAEP